MIPADTFTRTPVAKPGYPTDQTALDAAITPSGMLRSWADAHRLATELHIPPGLREHTNAAVWLKLTNTVRQYVAERGEDHRSLSVVSAALAQVIEAARPAGTEPRV